MNGNYNIKLPNYNIFSKLFSNILNTFFDVFYNKKLMNHDNCISSLNYTLCK